jgi:hypothetical protein
MNSHTLQTATPTLKNCHIPTDCHATFMDHHTPTCCHTHLQGLPHPYTMSRPPPRVVTPHTLPCPPPQTVTPTFKALQSATHREGLSHPYRVPHPLSMVVTPLQGATPTLKGCHTPTECHTHLQWLPHTAMPTTKHPTDCHTHFQELPHPYRLPRLSPRVATPLQTATPTSKGCHTPTDCHTHLQGLSRPPPGAVTPLQSATPTSEGCYRVPRPPPRPPQVGSHSPVQLPSSQRLRVPDLHPAPPAVVMYRRT